MCIELLCSDFLCPLAALTNIKRDSKSSDALSGSAENQEDIGRKDGNADEENYIDEDESDQLNNDENQEKKADSSELEDPDEFSIGNKDESNLSAEDENEYPIIAKAQGFFSCSVPHSYILSLIPLDFNWQWLKINIKCDTVYRIKEISISSGRNIVLDHYLVICRLPASTKEF